MRLEDYALIGDGHTAALVGIDGSIDWLCLPTFSSPACFASLLGSPANGRWLLSPSEPVRRTEHRYRGDTLVLETEMTTDQGSVRITDFMSPREGYPDVIRIVEGLSGAVAMRSELAIRYQYGSVHPWLRNDGGRWIAVAGPGAIALAAETDVDLVDRDLVSLFTVSAGDSVAFVMTAFPSYRPAPDSTDARKALPETLRWWERWLSSCAYEGDWREAVVRSLITLKALTYAPTGGNVAAPTTSLPEWIGGVRNWDYRYCWIRDASFTMGVWTEAGFTEDAKRWREWLLRAVAGDPEMLQVVFQASGRRELPERELPWLSGYEGSRPVRIGNQAAEQLQLDVYGELVSALHQARESGLGTEDAGWELERGVVEFLETIWERPDQSIWESRGEPKPYTYSRVMAWSAFDCGVQAAEDEHRPGPVERWRAVRDRVHAEVTERGYNPDRGAFVQSYGTDRLDAALLKLPIVGFLPAADGRIRNTVDAIQRELCEDGFVMRYEHRDGDPDDGLPPGEGSFLMCSFWLADALAMLGRHDEAREIFERVLSIRSDTGLLSEQYDTGAGRLVGNFPQAYSHVGLIDTAIRLSREAEPDPVRAPS